MSWADFEIEVKERMNPALATRIRELRVDQENSWRGVSEDIFDYPEAQDIAEWMNMRGHQPLGMFLCSSAAALLGEDWD